MNNYWVQDVLKSRNICNDDFIERFFSDANITRIQQTLIQKVKQEGYSITRQSEEQVYLLMKYLHLMVDMVQLIHYIILEMICIHYKILLLHFYLYNLVYKYKVLMD